MADEAPSLHIDTDWKKQAQEEKRKLAEAEKQRHGDRGAPAPAAGGGFGAGAPAAAPTGTPGAAASKPAAAREAAEARQAPAASFGTLVNSLLTQVLIYLGDVSLRGSEPVINLDTAKHLIDTLGVLEEKTKGNLTPEEQTIMDRALYEARMRYVAVASQYVNP